MNVDPIPYQKTMINLMISFYLPIFQIDPLS